MIELLSDFNGMKEFMKGSRLKLKEGLMEYYRQIGEKHGFTVLKDSSVIKDAFDFGKVDLVWVEPNVIFTCEFGLLDDIYRHLWRIMVLRPAVAALLLSGNSQCNPKKVKEIVRRAKELEGIEVVLLDVTLGSVV
ncbi:MAG: hypothetical protein V1744_04130 [Candidatus Altiarchaeota archaeon]